MEHAPEHAAHHAASGVSAILLVLFVTVPVALLIGYLRLAWQERRYSGWSGWRVASFTTGIALIVAAMTPLVSDWAHEDLRGHMVQHLLLGMFAPLGLALGALGTLLLRNVPVTTGRAIAAFLSTLPVRMLIHPVTAALLESAACIFST